MIASESSLSASINDFFLRSGSAVGTQQDCDAHTERLYSGNVVQPAACQGWCSYTLNVGHELIVQFRPPAYQLDMSIVQAARKLYGPSVPTMEDLGVHQSSGLRMYLMERMQGVSYKTFRESSLSQDFHCRRRLCEDFAVFLAKAWKFPFAVTLPLGKIGSTLRWRLERLGEELPMRFRDVAKYVLENLDVACYILWVLQHGDIVASNIMIDPTSGQLRGLVDWAEAEVLPFGTSLYGLEELLGSMTSKGFVYDSHAERLRALFYEKLFAEIPELRNDNNMLRALPMARDMGVLLWHGFAFDDGAINRVVEEGRDDSEIAYLDAFLDTSGVHTQKMAEAKTQQMPSGLVRI